MKTMLCCFLIGALPALGQTPPVADAPVSECDKPGAPPDLAGSSYCIRSAGEPAPVAGRLLSFETHKEREGVNAYNARFVQDIVVGNLAVVSKGLLYTLVGGSSALVVTVISLVVGLLVAHKP